MRWVEHGETKMKTALQARMTALRLFYRYARAKNFVLENPAEDRVRQRRATFRTGSLSQRR